MKKNYVLIIYLLLLLISCNKSPVKNMDKQEILKQGSQLFAKYGCAVCHSLEGKKVYGPPLNGIYMKEITVLRKGKEFKVVADRKYLKKSILQPRFEKVLEFKNTEMPIATFPEEEADILVEYIIALGEKN
ncbi:MAG: cytochrome c [Draconibacterium sp.]|nr:cytochrome c [Draconibacterium sp.]